MTSSYSFSHRIAEGDLAVVRHFGNTVPVRVGALAEALGLKVVLATLPMNISGSIQPDDQGGYIIKVNRFESKERQRFTIAHEIAHYLIHKSHLTATVTDSVLYRSRLSSRVEAEANRLAADIVMPRDAVYSAINNSDGQLTDGDIASLATEFGVSKQAMAIRVG